MTNLKHLIFITFHDVIALYAFKYLGGYMFCVCWINYLIVPKFYFLDFNNLNALPNNFGSASLLFPLCSFRQTVPFFAILFNPWVQHTVEEFVSFQIPILNEENERDKDLMQSNASHSRVNLDMPVFPFNFFLFRFCGSCDKFHTRHIPTTKLAFLQVILKWCPTSSF